ncbi:MAG: hypothetical protein WEC41_05560 [Dongiaceae bacterium]
MTSDRTDFVSKHQLPIEVNSFVVNPDGSVARQDPRLRPFAFDFAYHGVAFAARMRLEDDRPFLQLRGECGPLPYSVESIALRRDAFAVLLASRSLPHGRLALCTDRRILAVGDIALGTPMTPTNVIAATAQLLLEIRPYIELLRDLLRPRRGRNPAVGVAAPA